MSNPRPFKRARKAFSKPDLKRICEMHETDFPDAYDMQVKMVDQRAPDNWYAFIDNGSPILAVAHLDTVVHHSKRKCGFLDTADGPVVYSGALDDRLGAYTILELLPLLGIECDILLTVGEESGLSTANYFDPTEHHDREYNWAIEFDRGGTDVVMYQYEDTETEALVKASGARVGNGSFSDIAYLEHLEIKCFNWGVGYRDYHGPRGHAFLNDYWQMIAHFLKFHDALKDTYLPHEWKPSNSRGWTTGWWDKYDDEWCNIHKRYADQHTKVCSECAEEAMAEHQSADVVDAELVSEDFAEVQRQIEAIEAEEGRDILDIIDGWDEDLRAAWDPDRMVD